MPYSGNAESGFCLYIQLTFIANHHPVGKSSVFFTEICGKDIFYPLADVIG